MAPSADNQQNDIMFGVMSGSKESEEDPMKLRRHKGEPTVNYILRIEGWRYYTPRAELPLLNRCASTVAEVAKRAMLKYRDISLHLNARLLPGALCCCSDMVAQNQILIDTFPSLFEFYEAGRKGCVRCWYIARGIEGFADRMVGATMSDIRVSITGNFSHGRLLNGSLNLVRVLWRNTGVQEPWQISDRRMTLDLEFYRYEGGYTLFPQSRPRDVISVRSDSDRCFAKMKGWIDICVNKHSCGINILEPFLPTRIIDVEPDNGRNGVRLIQSAHITQKDARFVALSHCWGDTQNRIKQIPKTKIATIDQHLEHIEWDGLTKTFQDAVIVARRLEVKYLWIDSLCIIQDDKHDFVKEVSQLASIYGHAYVVLAATHAQTGDAGLFYSRPPEYIVSRIDPRSGEMRELRIKEVWKHEHFLTSDPHHFQSAPLLARAWCFQERLLGRRVIHFSAQELFFECAQFFACECEGYPDDNKNFKIKTLSGLRKNLSTEKRYELWYTVVEPYSTRILTVESDRLPALSGFAQLISMPEMGRYYAGLWENELPSGLLWRVLRARPGYEDVARPKDLGVPSWSWASVQAVIKGHIRWQPVTEVLARVEGIECESAALEDPFGEVASGFIMLYAPIFEVSFRQTGEEDQQQRACAMWRSEHETDSQEFEFDVPLSRNGCQGLCVAIQRWHPRICDGQASCLVLEPHAIEDSYVRVGITHCPADWLVGVERRSIRIV